MNKLAKMTPEELEILDKLQGPSPRSCHKYCANKDYPYHVEFHRLTTFFLLDRNPYCREFYKKMSDINFENPFFYELADELGNIRLELDPIVTEIETRLWDGDFTGIQFDVLKKNYRNGYEKECEFYDSLRKRILEYLAKEELKEEN